MSEPVRTCVACRTRRPQRALVRLRRRSDGTVVPAMGRGTRGRSAYLCPARACFDQAIRRRALERALGRSRSDEPRAQREGGGGSPDVAGRSPSCRVRGPELEVLWPSVSAALDHELENMQRTGDIGRSPRYDALVELRRGLGEPGRSA